MPKTNKKLRVAMPAWEIGRVGSGLGVKIGGLGVVVEELPPELIKAAARHGLDLEIETLTPCFAHYDKSQLTKLDLRLPATIEGYTFEFEVYEHIFPDGHKVIYFWDEWQLDGRSIKSCAIITTTANKLLATIHDRMPVILRHDTLDGWLRSSAKVLELREFLSPFPDSEMEGFPVSQEVNGSAADHPGLVERLPSDQLVRNGMLF